MTEILFSDVTIIGRVPQKYGPSPKPVKLCVHVNSRGGSQHQVEVLIGQGLSGTIMPGTLVRIRGELGEQGVVQVFRNYGEFTSISVPAADASSLASPPQASSTPSNPSSTPSSRQSPRTSLGFGGRRPGFGRPASTSRHPSSPSQTKAPPAGLTTEKPDASGDAGSPPKATTASPARGGRQGMMTRRPVPSAPTTPTNTSSPAPRGGGRRGAMMGHAPDHDDFPSRETEDYQARPTGTQPSPGQTGSANSNIGEGSNPPRLGNPRDDEIPW